MRNAAPIGGVRNWTGAVPSEKKLFGIVSELRRLNRTIAAPLERDLKRAGCPSLETYEVLRAIAESGDLPLRPAELQTRLALPQIGQHTKTVYSYYAVVARVLTLRNN